MPLPQLPNLRGGPMQSSPYRIQPQRPQAQSAPAAPGNILGSGAGPAPFAPAQMPSAPRPTPAPYRMPNVQTFGGGSSTLNGGPVGSVSGSVYGQRVSNPLLRYGVRGNVGGMSGGPRRPGESGADPSIYDASYRPPQPQVRTQQGSGNSLIDELQRSMAQQQAATEARYGQILDLNQQGRNDMLGDLNTSTGALQQQSQQGTQNLMGFAQSGANALSQAAGSLYGGLAGHADQRSGRSMDFLRENTQGMQGLAGQYSDAEQKLENQQYGSRQGEIKQEMLDRGLRNTTVDQPLLEEAALQHSIRSGLISDRGLDRQLNISDIYTGRGLNVMGEGDRNALNFAGQGAGAALGAQELGYRSGLDALSQGNRDSLNIGSNYANQRQGVLDNSRRERIGIIEGRTDQPPDLSMFYQLLSQPQGRVSGGVNYGGGFSSGPMGITPAGRGQAPGWDPFQGLGGGGVPGGIPSTVGSAQQAPQLQPLPPRQQVPYSMGAAGSLRPVPQYR